MTLVLATRNAHKIREMRQILSRMGIECVTQQELGCDLDVEETGTTFAENAYLKARAVMEATGLPAVADDSGLVVDALDGAPGVYSARFGGPELDDDGRTALLLERMEGREDRACRYVCAICCCFPDGRVLRSQATCEGEVGHTPMGDGGFGYDPVFWLPDRGCTMAQISAEEKNSISHRGKALRAFRKEWERNGADG
jgi:XTP/dITP diphosphohydrolase